MPAILISAYPEAHANREDQPIRVCMVEAFVNNQLYDEELYSTGTCQTFNDNYEIEIGERNNEQVCWTT